MENELLKDYKPVLNSSRILEKYEDQPLEQSYVKEIIHDVLQELQSRKNRVAKNGTKRLTTIDRIKDSDVYRLIFYTHSPILLYSIHHYLYF